MSETDLVTASCLCRAVAWSLRGPLFNMSHCHCGMCRKAHGAPFATYVGAKASGFQYERGEDQIVRYASSSANVRCFCGRCGSVVPGAPRGKAAYFMAGSIDDDPVRGPWRQVLPSMHVFVASKASWYAIEDDLPQHAEYPLDWQLDAVLATAPVATPDTSSRADGSLAGSCLCGRVAYEVAAGPSLGLFYCHCSRCRKARAAAHNANIFMPRERFSWLRGESELGSFKVPDAERFTQVFCRHCGSKMPIVRGDRAVAPAGSVDTPFTPADARHIHVASKAAWYEIKGEIPQWAEYPGVMKRPQ